MHQVLLKLLLPWSQRALCIWEDVGISMYLYSLFDFLNGKLITDL